MSRDLSLLPLKYLKGVGPKKEALFARLGVRTVLDALYYFPFRYEDRRAVVPFSSLTEGIEVSVMGTVAGVELKDLQQRGALIKNFNPYVKKGGARPRAPKSSLLVVTLTDGKGAILKAKWFNQPFLQLKFKPGQRFMLYGAPKLSQWERCFEIINPEHEMVAEAGDEDFTHTTRIVPVYRATEGLGVRQIRSVIHEALGTFAQEAVDPLPPDVRERMGLPDLSKCLWEVHFPPDDVHISALQAWRSPAQRRMVMEELFVLEAALALMKKTQQQHAAPALNANGDLVQKLVAALPFALTSAQQRAYAEIKSDIARPVPMNRLLQGDVGAGKTLIALMAMLCAVECGRQAALMAPTEILAEQHYITLHRLLEGVGLKVALLTSSTKRRPLDEIASGEIHIAIGTHALLEDEVKFNDLALVVIDEQHRFGVEQRAKLRRKGRAPGIEPHVLVMTATPIPRSLAMTLYGDLDASVIDALPPGRTPIETTLITEARKAEIYKAIQEEVSSGGQVYVVYPAIEETEQENMRHAQQGKEGMERKFPAMRVGLMHGRLKAAEKEAVMSGFKAGEIDILVSTTVIEVGVDVPNASLMVVVNAERYGLAQLHQLRGRVGRGRRVSRCMLLTYGQGEDSARRLDALCRTGDGFELARMDLEIRGPGEFMGTEQSGFPELKAAHIVRDMELIEQARTEAFRAVAEGAHEQHEPLGSALKRFWGNKGELSRTG